ncbi:MAG: tyrosine-protein phosphatase [Bacilli bacterium]|nr:tyrosine-protein phosphatase [Bacilli bacterium]
MKRTKLLTVISALFLLTACGEDNHSHTYGSEWKYDEVNHWHAATCEHKDAKSGNAAHSFGEATLVDGEKKVTCSTCGYTKDFNPNDVEHSDGFDNVTEFDDPIEIHTERQKEYLNYDGQYLTMPENLFPNGDATISDPVKTTITWDFDDDEEVSKYSVTIGQKRDLSDGFEIIGTKAKSLDLYNLFLGKNYYRVNAYMEDSKVGSDVYELTVDSTVPRNLYVGNRMTNCRDVGGKTLESGGKIRQGLLLRTCGSGYAMDRNYIDDEGKMILKDQLKVKSEINLNDSNAYNVNIEGTTVYDTFMDYAQVRTDSKHHFSRNTENVRNVFDILSRKESYPVFFHCRIGTDRTGLIAILVNGVLGVPLNQIYQDYLFSNFGKIGSKRKIGAGDDDDITRYMNEIQAMPGETFQEKVYNTLITIGVSREIIANMMNILVEGAAPENDNGQIVISAKDMTLSGTTLQTEDKTSLVARSGPASYAALKANATATAMFTTTAGTKSIYAYLGNNDSNTSKKVETSISVTLDGEAVTIPSISFKDAGMGKCNNRVNYYFVKLGEVTVNGAGQHTLVVKGLQNDMNIGNIAIF